MKRFAINTLAAAALLAGGITLTHTTAAQSGGGTEIDPPASCGSCHCTGTQRCRSSWFSCECY